MNNLEDIADEIEKQAINESDNEKPKLTDEISDIKGEDEASRLRALAIEMRNQDDLERDISLQVCLSFHDAYQAAYSVS